MSKPTPEDQFDGIAYGLCPIQHAPAAACDSCDDIEGALRAAVEAEREGCESEVDRLSLRIDSITLMQLKAAIRARGESE
jgi:hypothetical protein